jgi:hypothetical protein
MVQFVNNKLVDDFAEIFQIDQKACFRVNRSFYSYKKFVIVPVPVRV